MTLREEVLKHSGLLTEEILEENKIIDGLLLLKAPRDIFELTGDSALFTIYKNISKDKKSFANNWDKLDNLVSEYDPSKGSEVRILIKKIFDEIKDGKKDYFDEKYTFKYASSNKDKDIIEKYQNKSKLKSENFFKQIDMIRDRILSNLDKYDARYKEYKEYKNK